MAMVESERDVPHRSRGQRWYRATWAKFLVITAGVQILLLGAWAFTWPPVTLSFVVPAEEARDWQAPIERFEQQHPRIKINLVKGDNDPDALRAIYTADAQAPDPQYDLIYTDMTWTAPFVAAGLLQDLSPYVDFETLEGFLSSEIKAGRQDDQLYRLPISSDIGVLLTRSDLLQSTGQKPPQSFAALEGTVKLLEEKEKSAEYLWSGKQSEALVEHFVEILDGFGGFWIHSESQEVGLGKPEAVRAAQFMRSLIAKKIAPPLVTRYDDAAIRDRFLTTDTAAFLRTTPTAWSQLQAQYPELSLDPLPGRRGEPGRGVRGGWGLAMSSAAEHPEAAWKAIEYFTSEAVQKQWVQASGMLPSRTALFDDPDFIEQAPYLPQVRALLEEQSIFRPAIAQYPEASAILQEHLWKILIAVEDPKTGMAKAAAETRQLLGQSLP